MKKRVVITGMGIVSPIGLGKEKFWSSLAGGVTGIKEISLFDTSELKCKTAGEITDFDPTTILGEKGLRALDRSAKLVCSAARMAVTESGLEVTESFRTRAGVVIGTTRSYLHSFASSDRKLLREGFSALKPMDFPSTVPNVAAGHVSLMFGVEGFNTTLSGEASSLDAINFGASFIRMGRVDIALAGGVESLTLDSFLEFYLPGFLAGSRGDAPEICAPFDLRRNGPVLGEASAVVVLEDYEHARARGANIYAEVLGFGSAFDPKAASEGSAKGMVTSMKGALDSANVLPRDIDYLSANANSSFAGDLAESVAIKRVFGESPDKLHVSAIKLMTAETFGAGGALQTCASCLAIGKNIIPPTINRIEKDPDCDIPIVDRSLSTRIDTAMINSFGVSGISSSLVIARV